MGTAHGWVRSGVWLLALGLGGTKLWACVQGWDQAETAMQQIASAGITLVWLASLYLGAMSLDRIVDAMIPRTKGRSSAE